MIKRNGNIINNGTVIRVGRGEEVKPFHYPTEPQENIERCLNCTRKKCNNCLDYRKKYFKKT